MSMTKRQNELLFYIVEEYVANPIPVGSKTILKKYMSSISAATIRNEMVNLEKNGMLEKVHNSSGRVPSIKAYKLYEKSINSSNIDENLLKKLRIIFMKRNISINKIIDESTSLISAALNLPLIVTEIQESDLLKGINLIQTNANSAIIIIITSSGGVHKNIIEFESKQEIIDISICIRIFNDYLIDVKMNDINEKIISLEPIIKSKVTNYEKTMQDIISKIFINSQSFKMNVKGQSELLLQPEFENKENLKKVINVLEKTSVWQQIAYQQYKNGGNTKIIFGDEIGEKELSIGSTTISLGESISQISVLGPTRMDYTNVKAVLEFIKQGLSDLWKK